VHGLEVVRSLGHAAGQLSGMLYQVRRTSMKIGVEWMAAGKLPCLLLVCTTLSGCMSISTLDDGGSSGIYRGVRGDMDCMRTALDGGGRAKGLFCEFELPFSLVLDTVFLPFTLIDTFRSPDETVEDPGNDQTAAHIAEPVS
jgi:uncharacterized protein YceK